MGNGVSVDYVEAYKWFKSASEQGHEGARELIDSLEKVMTREQITEAKLLNGELAAK